MTSKKRSALVAASLVASSLLSGCNQAAEYPSRWLPSPWPGYHGRGENLTKGSAFGVSVGMTRERAASILKAGHRFNRLKVFCGIGGSDEAQPYLGAPEDPPAGICPKGNSIEDIWGADPSILCGFCESELLELFIVDNQVKRIWFHGGGEYGSSAAGSPFPGSGHSHLGRGQ
jgi:hypothetical protein